MNKAQRNIQYKTLIVNIVKGKFGEYPYKSPRWGYKRAYHYDKIIVVIENDRIIARIHTKYWKRQDVLDYIEQVYQFTLTTDFNNMVDLYKQAQKLSIDNGYVRDLRAKTSEHSTNIEYQV